MNDVNTEIFEYELPLLIDFPREKSKNLLARGCIIAFTSSNGEQFYGEMTEASCASAEAYSLAKAQLQEAVQSHQNLNDMPYASQVLWAVSSAKQQWENRGKKDATQLGGGSLHSVPLNVLLDASKQKFVDQAVCAYAQGYRVFKVKVSEQFLSFEIDRIREFSSLVGSDIRIRLDGNQGLSIYHAVEFARTLRKMDIEYFEEPFLDATLCEELFRLTNVRTALDESLSSPFFSLLKDNQAIAAFVIKPAHIGTHDDVMRIIADALALEKSFVVSSTYESGIGLSVLANYAFVPQSREVAMGLSTGAYFAADFLSPPIRPFRGKLLRESMTNSLSQVNLKESSFCRLL